MMKLGHVELFVRDPLRAKDFYINTLGFDHVTTQGENFVWLAYNGQEFLLRPGEPPRAVDAYQRANIAFVFYADDFEHDKHTLESRGLVFKGTDGSDACLTFTDSDGNWFQFTDPNH
jgi:catechol 2,3-dioxygenase-like lactoylglutathione lyase family enzyme